MIKKTDSRDFIVKKMKEELVGPAPYGTELDCTKEVVFKDLKETFQSFVQKGTLDEIIQRDSPLTRYGVSVLQPLPMDRKKPQTITDPLTKVVFGETGEFISRETKDAKSVEAEAMTPPLPSEENEFAAIVSNRLELASANKYLPNSMAISLLAKIDDRSQLVVSATGGRYRELPVIVGKEKRLWWKREAVEINAKFSNLKAVFKSQKIKPSKLKTVNTAGLNLSIEVHARPTQTAGLYFLTVVLINRTREQSGKMPDLFALFQSEFSVRVISPSETRNIMPYPVEGENAQMSSEEQSIDLLYRHARTFAVGHGCAADWDREVHRDEKVREVIAHHFPVFEVPQTTSEIRGGDNLPLEISMAKCAGLVPGENGLAEISELIEEYGNWISRSEHEIQALDARHHYAASSHLAGCRRVHARMQEGFALLQSNSKALDAFRLANHAVLLQQHRSKTPLRQAAINQATGQPFFFAPLSDPDLFDAQSKLGKWRAFQIAFLLTGLCSAIDPECPDRETVDLIWFPTAGGKTEAYLSLAAFTIFYRRLVDPGDAGTTVLTRYTLRLLTAQQFQRTGALICAMETLRLENQAELGTVPLTLGLWLGNDVTPGSRRDALYTLRQLIKHPRTTPNKFVLNRCPWCAAEIGKIEQKIAQTGQSPKTVISIIGYKIQAGTVVLHCPDPGCRFHEALPIYVTDEDLYQQRPTFFIATVDKFAVLAWKPQAKALFGLDEDGHRIFSPPQLIIQDEEHLITGPLGTMVGVNEPVVEELCTDWRVEKFQNAGAGEVVRKARRPKIIAATATTRAAGEQTLALFGRERMQLFPPPGLDAGDSFFAQYARDADGQLLPGRLYAGINAPGLGSMQSAEVRVYAALLQVTGELPPETRNPYWTLMIFFNNLKWLGNTVSLFQSLVPSYCKAYNNRVRLPRLRFVKRLIELTGQLRGDEVLAALKKLETDWRGKDSRAIDVCLCSSIAEVGVDVPRLSLMAVVGQPKTTAQYIQITSRVGRDNDYPGLVVTIYSPLKARDRSHFERFRSYHERLYAQVEPVSITPFSGPALERGLHAALAAYIRQTGSHRQAFKPFPYPRAEVMKFKDLMLARLQRVAPEMRDDFERIFSRRCAEWQRWEHAAWSPDPRDPDSAGLLRSFDKWTDERRKERSWPTPISMRNVDSESEFRLTHYYQTAEYTAQGEPRGEPCDDEETCGNGATASNRAGSGNEETTDNKE